MLDFHNHLMPGVDDGAANIEESREGLSALTSQGVTEIITTPHLRGSFTRKPADLARALEVFDESWTTLLKLRDEEFNSLRLERGVELMLDVPNPDLSDSRVRLAGSSFALVEFPFMGLPPNSSAAIRDMTQKGWRPIIAHPERYNGMGLRMELVEEWRVSGAGIQVNAGSLAGQYGATARSIGWALIEHGLADYLCSDYHSRGRCSIEAAGKLMENSGGAEHYYLLTSVNPRRILDDALPLTVPALKVKHPPLWKRLTAWR
ncbi:MAG: CpsB/CapC family capsule biosynthesis tyrosine phosphatase [Gemmatimonadaceae bacterium]